MKRIFLSALLCFFLITQAQSEVKHITILHLNETHSNLLAGSPRDDELNGKAGGIARAVSLIKKEKSKNPNTMLLHTGGFSSGDLFYNKYYGDLELTILSLQGLDAVGIQCNEFDRGAEIFQQTAYKISLQTGINFISSNLEIPEDENFSDLKNLVKKKYVKDFDGVKIGVLQLGVLDNLNSDLGPLRYIDNYNDLINELLSELKAEEVDIIILISGLDKESNLRIPELFPSIDIVIANDYYASMQEPIVVENSIGGNSYILCSSPNYRGVGKISIEYDEGIESFSWSNINLDSTIKEDLQVKAILDVYTEDIDTSYSYLVPAVSHKLAEISSFYKEHLTCEELHSPGYKDTPIASLICKAYTHWAENNLGMEDIDFSVIINGATMQPLYEGPINALDLFRVISYGFSADKTLGNRLVRISLTGAQIIAGLSYSLTFIDESDDFFIQSDRLKYTYNSDVESLFKLTDLTINGEAVDIAKTYNVITNEIIVYALNFLGIAENYEILENSSEYYALIEYVLNNPLLDGSTDNNILNIAQGSAVQVLKESSNSQISVFPNPSQNTINFCIEDKALASVSIAIYDNQGRAVKARKSYEISQNSSTISLDIQDLSSGVYTYIAGGNSFLKFGKFIKTE
ncbi:MAG: T9SS type A sorting domain-containing protein [Ignavibacteria bacterium]|nr:T9SS type A sorting domain-containing protein [Ignavibacteria bacterium]